MDKIAVLIPCYNEEKTIEKVVHEVCAALPEAVVYVYDNNCTDNTSSVAAAAGAVVRRETRQGKGNVVRTMFREIDAECYLMLDGDDTYPTEYARALCDAVLSGGADMAIGDRLSATYFTENKRPFHNLGNVLVRQLVNRLFEGDVLDIMTGYRAFSPLFVKSFAVMSKGFEIETEMTVHALDKGFRLVSIPVQYRDRPDGSVSKLNTYRDGARVLRMIFGLYKDHRPLRFFGAAALVLALLSLLMFAPVLADYLHTGLVPKFPTLIVAGFIGVSACLSLACGCVLDTLVKKEQQAFALSLNQLRLTLNAQRENGR